MRPVSIVNFERFYLGAVVVGLVNTFISWDSTVAAVEAALPPGLQFGSGFLLTSIVIGILITLLLWYYVAKRASVVAKWIVVIFFLISLVSFTSSLAGGEVSSGLISPLAFGLSLVAIALEALAVWMLFRPDANAWFAGRGGEPQADVFS